MACRCTVAVQLSKTSGERVLPLERSAMSFKAKLLSFAFTIILILAVPLLYFECRRPWDLLYALIGKSEAQLIGIESAMDADELARMNAFALDVHPSLHLRRPKDLPPDHYDLWANSHSFYLILDKGGLPTASAVRKTFIDNGLVYTGYRYEALSDWYAFWKRELNLRPGLERVLRKYRVMLKRAHELSDATGFRLSNIYMMCDTSGPRKDLLTDSVVLVMESLPWWEASCPGELYNLTKTSTHYFRASYDAQLGGKLGFHHNKIADPNRFYLPQFDKDEWGTWFSGWRARQLDIEERGPIYSNLLIDFNAETVQGMMLRSVSELGLLAVSLVLILFLATRQFSRWLTRPISALTDGAEAVIARRYDHEVPAFGNDEFFRLTTVFNRMIRWVGEMVNLRDALTKMLSEELAEKAATEGLVIGGQEVDCSIMFTDFAGFSTLARYMSAAEAVGILNHYFKELIPIVKQHGGFPDKYIGDAIVAIFGAPVRIEDHATRAVNCAIDLQRKIRAINLKRRQEGKPHFEMRVGINSGVVIAGAIGCDLKLEYTSIGETTNLANRMESKCQIGHILISENTYRLIDPADLTGVTISPEAEKEMVKGYADAVGTYRIQVSDVRIHKNPASADPQTFYVYEVDEPG